MDWSIEENEEIKRFLIEHIAAGLRQLKEPPDFFIFQECTRRPDGLESVCGIPVLYTYWLINAKTKGNVPVLPLWKNPGRYVSELAKFNAGYSDSKKQQALKI